MQSILSLSINAARALIARSQALTVFSAIVVMSRDDYFAKYGECFLAR